MKLSRIGRVSMALVVSVAMGLGMTACGGGTIGFMWVLGTQYNQIAGFKIDDFTGNLTQVIHSPFSSAGANPVSLVVKPGGRYVYVINKGTATRPQRGEAAMRHYRRHLAVQCWRRRRPDLPAVLQQPGIAPSGPRATVPASSFMYWTRWLPVRTAPAPPRPAMETSPSSRSPAYGRLSLVLNQQIKDPLTGAQLTYFPVGNTPSMLQLAGGGCLFTLDKGDQTIFPYSVSGGQLTLTANSTVPLNTIDATSINSSGSLGLHHGCGRAEYSRDRFCPLRSAAPAP